MMKLQKKKASEKEIYLYLWIHFEEEASETGNGDVSQESPTEVD